jgi:AraC family transcriptional regulator
MSIVSQSENLSTPIVIQGKLQAPSSSSASRGWRGLVLQTFPGWRGRTISEYPFHVVSLQLAGQREIFQRRNGHSSQQVTRAGSIIITPMGPAKEWCNGEQSPCSFVVINLSPSLFDRILEDRIRSSRSVELLDCFGTRDAQLESLIVRLLEEFRCDELASSLYVEALASQLAVQLLRHYSTLRELSEPAAHRLSRSKFRRATDYIDANLAGDLTVGVIAEALSMSGSNFARAFKHTTGLAPHHYVLERRLEKAKTLLRETNSAIADIAHEIGFSGASHFTVAFARRIGCTPRRYRRDA